jgi:hypothetical protein
MSEKDLSADQALREKQMDELYQAIGHAVVEFELMVDRVRMGIETLLVRAGLTIYSFADAMVAGQTAYSLGMTLRAMLGGLPLKYGPDEIFILDTAFNRYAELCAERNDIVHGTWFIGHQTDGAADWSVAQGYKAKHFKEGTQTKILDRSAADFDHFAEECMAIGQLILGIWGGLRETEGFGHNLRLSASRTSILRSAGAILYTLPEKAKKK